MSPLSPLPPALRTRPFTTAEALRHGLSPDVLRTRRVRSPFHAVHVPCELPDTLATRCAALALVLPGTAAYSHVTAALLYDLPLPDWLAAADGLHATVPFGTTVPQGRGIVGHESVRFGPVCTLGPWALRVVHPWRTWCDLVPRLRDDDAIILGDAVVGRSGRAHLEQMIAGRAGERGVVRMRRLFAVVREKVDSPMETRTRLLFLRAGLPEPECGREAHADDGYGWLAVPDLSWPEYKVAVEYDGDIHRTKKRKWRNDIARKMALEDDGWRVIVVTADDIFKRPEETVRRVRRALIERGWRPTSA